MTQIQSQTTEVKVKPAKAAQPVFGWAAWKRRWQKVSDKIPLRWSGLFLMGSLSAMFYFVAYQKQDLVLLVTCSILMILAVLMILLVIESYWAVARGLKRREPLAGQELYRALSGKSFHLPLGFRIPYRPFVEVEWTWLSPQGAHCKIVKQNEQWCEEIRIDQRCQIESVERWIEVRDVLGISALRRRWIEPMKLEILPVPSPIDQQTLVTSLHIGEDVSDPAGEPVGDRVDMRRYAAGDPPRFILWKVLARSGKLMVRVPERAFSPTPRTCAYFVAGPHDEACAGLARSILENGVLGAGWRFGADGTPQPSSDVSAALSALAVSGNSESRANPGLAEYLQSAHKDGYQSCLVLVPSSGAEWLKTAESSLKRAGMPITVILVNDGSDGGNERSAKSMQAPVSPDSRSLTKAWSQLKPWLVNESPLAVGKNPQLVASRLQKVSNKGLVYNSRHTTVQQIWGGRAQ